MGKKKKVSERVPDLREFIKENDQRLYDFCVYMLYSGGDSEDLILDVFRLFGDQYRRVATRKEGSWEPAEVRLRLFKTAWERIRGNITLPQIAWTIGRDTRQLKGLDEDLLEDWKPNDPNFAKFEGPILERLSRIDPDFRAPLVLRDILRFDDEEVLRILGLRWGVYRHRLHRGRLEFKDALRGRPATSEAKSIPLPIRGLTGGFAESH